MNLFPWNHQFFVICKSIELISLVHFCFSIHSVEKQNYKIFRRFYKRNEFSLSFSLSPPFVARTVIYGIFVGLANGFCQF